MIRTRLLRELVVDASAHPGGPAHLSAASGLVHVGGRLYVVADDEHHLGVLDVDGGGVRLVQVRGGELPADAALRKRGKPDLEALALLPPGPGWPHGALMAVGSGSRPNRQHGFVGLLDARGGMAGAVMWFALDDLYDRLRERLGELNIEGAFVTGSRLCLLNRAHRGHPVNACISLPLAGMERWLGQDAAAPPLPDIATFELGEEQGAPFGFTDGTASRDGGWLFSAVAEDTGNSYDDGRCLGCAIGRVSSEGRLLSLELVDGAPKIEGLAIAEGVLLAVTDADDRGVAARLLSLPLPS
jgi:hypothetical protein